MDMNPNQPMGKMCKCPHHKMWPLLIILVGLTFLLEAFGVFSSMAVNVIWPILLIIFGFSKMCKCDSGMGKM